MAQCRPVLAVRALQCIRGKGKPFSASGNFCRGSGSRNRGDDPCVAATGRRCDPQPRGEGRTRPGAPSGGAVVPVRRRPRAGRGGASCRLPAERGEACGQRGGAMDPLWRAVLSESLLGRWRPGRGAANGSSEMGGRRRLGSSRLPSRAPREKARRSRYRGRRALAPRSVVEAARSGSAERSAELRACGRQRARARRASYKGCRKSQRRAASLCVRSRRALRLGVSAQPVPGARRVTALIVSGPALRSPGS